jgi:hypothetical protein
MTTTAQNTVDALNRNQTRVQLPVTTNLTVNQGDFVYWDGTNFTVTPVTNKSQITGNPTSGAGTFLGVALQSNAALIYPGDPDQVGVLVLVRGVVWANTTAEDTYGWFTPVTIGEDSQTITSASAVSTIGSTYNIVGVTLPPVATSPRANQATPTPETIAGGTGVRVQVALMPGNIYAAAI